MADEVLKRDQNSVTVLAGVTDNVAQDVTMLRVDPTTKRLLVSGTGGGSGTVTSVGTGVGLTGGAITTTGTISLTTPLQPIASLTGNALKVLRVNAGETAVEYATVSGTGTVTSVSVVSANGFTGSVATATTTPAITLTTSITSPVLAGNGTAISAATTTGTGSTVVLGTSPTIVTPVLNGTPSGTGVSSTASSSTLALRDSSANVGFNNTLNGYTTTATAGTTTTLTVSSTYYQFFSGTTSSQILALPVVTTLTLGHSFYIVNNTTGGGLVQIQSSGGSTVINMASTTYAIVTCVLTSGTTAASWSVTYFAQTTASGKKLTVSNSIFIQGTDGTVMTFPSTSDTVVGIAATQTLTSKTLTTPTITKPVMDATNPSAQTYSPAGGGTATVDCSLSNTHRIQMPAGNITVAVSNDTNAQKFLVEITQDVTGSRTVTWFTTIKWAGGVAPTLTTTGSKRDVFGFERTGSGTYDGYVVGQNI